VKETIGRDPLPGLPMTQETGSEWKLRTTGRDTARAHDRSDPIQLLMVRPIACKTMF
jgi:hypothetical protein